MAIDFPDSPSLNDTYVAGGKTYKWDGTAWEIYGPNVSPGTFKIDDVNNRVGINNASPSVTLDVTGDAAVSGDLDVAGTIAGGTTTFPTTLDSGTMPALEALQAKVGVDSSAVTTSHDYKIAQIESDISTAQSDITALENAAPQSGSIIQTQWTTLPVTNFQTTASTIQNTGFSVNFTPQYASSKVLHILVIGAYFICDGQLKIYRGGSPAVNISLADSFRDVSTTAYIYDMPPTTVTLLDSPNTTSQITYQIWAYASGCSRICYIGTTGDFTPTWLLMEVAA